MIYYSDLLYNSTKSNALMAETIHDTVVFMYNVGIPCVCEVCGLNTPIMSLSLAHSLCANKATQNTIKEEAV